MGGFGAVLGRTRSILPDRRGARHAAIMRTAAQPAAPPTALGSGASHDAGRTDSLSLRHMSVDHVTLRPVAEHDLPVMDRFRTEPEVSGPFQWFGWSETGRWRRLWAENGLLTDDSGHLMVVRDTEQLGFVAWRKVVVTRSSFYWNVGIGLLPDARGKGVGTEAQRQLVHYLFAHTLVQRIEADTEVGNSAEQRALEKAGFTREGVHRSVVFRDGQWRDLVRYSILRGDFDPTAARH